MQITDTIKEECKDSSEHYENMMYLLHKVISTSIKIGKGDVTFFYFVGNLKFTGE